MKRCTDTKWLVVVLLCASMAVFLLVAGCNKDLEVKKDPFFEKWRLEAAKSQGTSPAPRERSLDTSELAALAEDESVSHERAMPTNRVTLKMRNASVDVVMRALARAANQNLLIKSDVKGDISVDFRNVPWNEAFMSIMRSKNLTYVWDGRIIRIADIKDLQNELKIEEIQEKRREQEILRGRLAPLHTMVIPIDFITVSTEDSGGKGLNELRDNIESFLTRDEQGKPYGSVRISAHSNSILVQATEDDLKKILPIIEKLDKPMPQILIEAAIVETTSEVARSLGMQWGGLYHGTQNDRNYWVTAGSNTAGVIGESINAGLDPTTGIAANFPALGLEDTGGLTIGYVSQKIGSYVLDVQLSALEQDGKVNILSRPSITTLDNQTAFTESGEKVPYATVDEDGDREVEFEEALLRLEITPHVIDGKNMKMDINIKKDEVDLSRTVDGNPFIIKKETETTLIIQDGNTVVISGLSKSRNLNSDSGVPWLRELPLFGYLFKRSDKDKLMEEVLIFITPHILKETVDTGEEKTEPSSTSEPVNKTDTTPAG
ncbi:MAG: type IV pilus secretin PilQ [Deltaproteobacteria bacterium]|nr:type IV pilus secretin PilQ [Deltaproteobacteria bacterium]